MIVGLIAIAFVLVFGQPSSGGGSNVVAEIDGEIVPRDSFDFFREQLERAQRAQLPPGADRSAFSDQLDLITLETLLRRYIMAQEARALGLRVSDEEIREEICSQPAFLSDGRCDPELLAGFIERSFGSERTYTEEIRRDLLKRKMERLLTSPVRISHATARERLLRDRLELRLRFVALRADDFREQVSASEEAAAALAEAEPERIAAAYERRLAEFQQPERVRARHILFQGDDALARAQAARARIDAGEDFVVLATALSEDEASREQGGDLGFFPRGRMLLPFEEAAFAAPERSVVGPVETERGQHLIRVEEREAGLDVSLEQASPALALDLVSEELAREAAREAAEGLASALRDGAALDELAREAGLVVEVTPFFRASERLVPGIGSVPGLRETAARLTPDAPSPGRVFGGGDAFYLIELAERRELDAETLATAVEPAREQLTLEARDRLLQEWYRQRREDLEADGRVVRYPLYLN